MVDPPVTVTPAPTPSPCDSGVRSDSDHGVQYDCTVFMGDKKMSSRKFKKKYITAQKMPEKMFQLVKFRSVGCFLSLKRGKTTTTAIRCLERFED
jgi:hypothetical protein